MEQASISCIQKVVLYETKARYYVVGSNATETSFRVVKLDRTESRDLVLHDDKVEYTKRQIRNMLTMIKSGNTTKENKDSELGLIKTVSAFGIIGFVKFLEGYYVILITKRRKVALIGPHIIYKVEDTSMLYIPNDSVRYSHPEEARYVKLFQSIDLSSNFYFSYSYDLTHSLQYNMISVVPQQKGWNLSQEGQHQSRAESESEGQKQQDHTSNDKGTVYSVKWKSEDKYVWNSYLLKCCRHLLHTDWILCLTHGFVDQKNICVYGKPLYLTLIARRSNRFAGTRFLKRGANSEGYVANEVETEQIVIDNSVTFLDRANVTSFVQTRGSIPLYWSQDVAKMVPKPPIMLDQRDTFAGAAGLHFNQLLKRHGAPVIILNLVKRHERRRHESILTEEFKATLSYLNQFLPNEHKIQYIGFDMAQVSKSKKKSVLGRLEEIAKFCVKQSGFYINMQKQVRDNFWEVDECKGIKGHKTAYGCQQTGVVRTNCVDCLDRTNTAQFALGKCALGYQMFVLGVIPSPDLEYDTDCLKMLEQLYEAQGDTIALQYGGSQLVHRIEGYRKIAPWTSHSKDIMHTLSRYYSNTFSDLEKQHATNIFLGLFTPAEGKLNMWELPTDFYLHNRDVPGIMGYLCRSYCQWWDVPVYKSLPLPYVEVRKSEDSQVDVTTEDDERVNHYEDYYRTSDFTPLHELFSMTISHSVRDYKPKAARLESPFASRVSADTKETGGSHEVNPNISGKDSTSSLTSTGSSDSDQDSTDVDADMSMSETSSNTSHDVSDFEEDETTFSKNFQIHDNRYGPDLHKYILNKHDLWSYERYVQIGELCHKQPEPSGQVRGIKAHKVIEVFPKSVFKFGSSYGVEPPPVNKQDQDTYHNYVNIGAHGPREPSKKEIQFYNRYLLRYQ